MSARLDLPPDSTTWRQIALVTVLVVLAHAALLAGLQLWGTNEAPLPLEHRFVTRTIVLAPPTPPAATSPAPTEAAAPEKAPEHHAARPRRSAAPHSAPRPHEEAPPAPVLAAPDAGAQMARIELTPPPAEPPAAAEPAPVNEPGTSNGTADASAAGGSAGVGGDDDAGAAIASAPKPGQGLQVHASVRMNFEMLGQRGVQPWKGVFGEMLWLQDGSEYNARLAFKVMWKTIRSQTSVGHVTAAGVAPDRFSETRKTEVASHLVRGENKIVFSNNAPTAPLLPGAQDRLSVVMQLGALLAGDAARYPEGSRISIQTVGPREAGVWTFVVEGMERISVPSGEYDVRRLSRTPRNEHDYKLELWLAPELGWLPARMRQTQQDGDVIDLQLRDVSAP